MQSSASTACLALGTIARERLSKERCDEHKPTTGTRCRSVGSRFGLVAVFPVQSSVVLTQPSICQPTNQAANHNVCIRVVLLRSFVRSLLWCLGCQKVQPGPTSQPQGPGAAGRYASADGVGLRIRRRRARARRGRAHAPWRLVRPA